MDEPTAALSAHEVDRLFDIVELLRREGTAVLFISHRLQEVFDVCQRVTVMRDGRHVFTKPLAGLVADDLVQAMVGREVVDRAAGGSQQIGDVVLAVDRLSREGIFTDVSFTVRSGEIVVLAGLVGSGRSEVARAIFGIDQSRCRECVDQRATAAVGVADRCDCRRRRLRPRGQTPAGAGHGDGDRPQYRPCASV